MRTIMILRVALALCAVSSFCLSGCRCFIAPVPQEMEHSMLSSPIAYTAESLLRRPLTEREVSLRLKVIHKYPDYRSTHTLFVLKYSAPRYYDLLPPSIKARILVSWLEHSADFNDWAELSAGSSGESELGKELISCGMCSVIYLFPLLYDGRNALFGGSSERYPSQFYRYRVCDYAYRYICIIQNIDEPAFFDSVAARDQEIARLICELRDVYAVYAECGLAKDERGLVP